MKDVVELSGAAAEGLGRIGIGDFNRIELPERMAWVVLVLKVLPDRPEWFPRGKWATIQSIEGQLAEWAALVALKVYKP
jgi:hypothetical protein